VQFLDKPNGNGQMQPDPDAAGDTGDMPDGGAPAQVDDLDDDIPF